MSLRAAAHPAGTMCPQGVYDSGGVVVDARQGAISYIGIGDRRAPRRYPLGTAVARDDMHIFILVVVPIRLSDSLE